MPCPEAACSLDYEALLDDELIRLVMASDGVTRDELAAVLLRVAEARAAENIRS